MTIRDYLKRRAWAWLAMLVLIALVGAVIWYLGFIGAFANWWQAMLVVFGAFFIANWVGAFALKCPACTVRFTGDVFTALLSKSPSRRFNYCPGCGVKLEDQWRDPNRL